jgi:ParB family chromosome partitioning protein
MGLGRLIPDANSVNVTPSKQMLDAQVKSTVGVDLLVGTKSPKIGQPEVRSDLMPVPGARFAELSVKDIVANRAQPRDVFDEDYLNELAASIKEFGVIQPIRVREATKDGLSTGKYELIAGERRLRASKMARKKTVPAIIAEVEDDNMLSEALIENLHRVNLNPLEVAAAYRQLMDDFKLTQEQLSSKIGTSRPRIANTLRLLKLPLGIQKRVASGVLSEGHARALLGVKDLEYQESLATRIVQEGLSVRSVEEQVALWGLEAEGSPSKGKTRQDKANKALPAVVASTQAELSDYLDTTVQVKPGRAKGQIIIAYADENDLKRISAAIQN